MQSDVRKRKTNILTHICGIEKNGTDDKPICRAEIETQTRRMDVDTVEEAVGGTNCEDNRHVYTTT